MKEEPALYRHDERPAGGSTRQRIIGQGGRPAPDFVMSPAVDPAAA
jgi:hypothetical protein